MSRSGRTARWLAGLVVCCAAVAAAAQEPPPAPLPGVQAADPFRTKLEAIRDDLLALRFEQALASIDALAAEPDLDEAARVETLALRSQAHVALGSLDAAERDYREILKIRPEFAPDENLTPRKAMERFTKARAEMVGSLILQLQPAKARVTIDGRPVPAPVATVPLVAGEHLVRAELEGFDPLQQTVEVAASRETRLELRMVPNARTVVVVTEPAGVEVSVDGVRVGRTERPTPEPGSVTRPSAELRIEHLALGEHVFELSKPCFRTETFRDLVAVDLLDWSTKRYRPIALAPVSSTIVPRGGPIGADLRVDGESVGGLPLSSFEVCPGARSVEVRHAGRRIWVAASELVESSEWVLEITPRPNLLLLGADSWPPELQALEAASNAGLAPRPPQDLASPQAWAARARELPADTDLLIARGSGTADAPGVWVFYSPILNAVARWESGRLAAERPRWRGVRWGLFVADSDVGGPARVVEVVADGPAARAGLQPADRLVSLGGTQVPSSENVHRILAVASAGAPLDAEWLSPDGTSNRGQLQGIETARLVPGAANAVDRMVRAAWALVDSLSDPDEAPLATANLALLLSEFDRPELAVRAWKRAVLPERAGIGHGTLQYYLGHSLQRLGRENEAVRALTVASQSEATVFDDEGPVVAPAARDRLIDLGVAPD